MLRIRVATARLYAVFIHAQSFIMSCRSKLIKLLLLVPMMLLPKAVLADGNLVDTVCNVEQGAKTTQPSSLTVTQLISVILSLGGLIDLEKAGKQGGMGLASCIVSVVIEAVLVAGPEVMSRSRKQLEISLISIG